MLGKASKAQNLLTELRELASLPETPSCLDTHLRQLASAAARLLGAERCTFVWLHDEHSAPDADAAFTSDTQPTPHDDAVFKRVVVDNQLHSTPGSRAFDGLEAQHGSALSAPVRGSGRVIGVVHVSRPKDKPGFDHEDVWMLNIVTVYIGKSLQTVQLQNILQSRLAQIALAQSVDDTVGKVLAAVPHPGRLVKILARSFYREMTKAGFGANEIINAASQIIGELSASLQRHAKRHNGALAEGLNLGEGERHRQPRLPAAGKRAIPTSAVE